MTSTIRFDFPYTSARRVKQSALVFTCALLLAGCAAQPVRRAPVALPLPARPTLPAVPASALQCLAPGTYTDIVNRERGYKTWGLELEAIIQTNNAKAGAVQPP